MVAALIDLKSVEDEIHCPVCKGEIRQCWYLRHCLHRFCHDCFLRSLRNDVRSCPVCRVRVASKRDAEADPRFDRLIEVLTRLGRGADDSSGDDEVDIASIMRQQQERAAALRKEAARLAARPWVPSQAAQAHAAAAGHLPEAGRKTMPLGRKAEPWRRDRQESEAPEEEEEEDEEEQETSACSSQQDAGQVEDEGDEEYEPEPWQRHMVGRNASRMAAAAMPPLHATGSPSARGVKPGAAVFLPPVLSSGDSGGACSPQRHSGGGARKPKRSSDAAVPAAGGSRLAKRSRAGFPADGEAGGGSPLRHGLDCNGNSAEGQREADGSMPNTTPLQAVQAVRILKQISRRLEADEPWPGQVVLHLVPAPAPPPPQPPATTGQLEDAAEAAIPQPAFQQLPPIPHPYLICPLQMRFESLIGLLMKSFPREAIQRVNRAGGRAQIQLLLGNAVPASQYRDALPMTTTLLQAEGHCYPTQPHMVVHYRLQPLAAV